MWPVEGMPYGLQQIAWYLPCTASCQAMRDIMSRGWGIAEPNVYLGVVSSVSWSAVFILMSWAIIKVRNY